MCWQSRGDLRKLCRKPSGEENFSVAGEGPLDKKKWRGTGAGGSCRIKGGERAISWSRKKKGGGKNLGREKFTGSRGGRWGR